MKFRVGGIVNYLLYPFVCVFFFPIGTWAIYDIIFGPDYNNWGKFFHVLVILLGLFALSLLVYRDRFYVFGKISFSEDGVTAFLRKPFFTHTWSEINEIGLDLITGLHTQGFVLVYFSTDHKTIIRAEGKDIFKLKFTSNYMHCLLTFKQTCEMMTVMPADKKILWINKECAPELVGECVKNRL